MYIKKIIIENFKCFEKFEMCPNEYANIIVGDNNEGKSTILEAINICISGIFKNKYLKNTLTQDIFNRNIVNKYLEKIKTNKNAKLPYILIEIYLEGADPQNLGQNNSEEENETAITFKIEFDSKFQNEYELLKKNEIITLPIEYYKVTWMNSAGMYITGRTVPIKSILIDTSSNEWNNASDTCLSKIIKNKLDESDIIKVSQAYRKARDNFIKDDTIADINKTLTSDSHMMNNKIEIDVEMLNRNDWEKAIITKVNDIPFEFIGKGEQSNIKIEMALTSHKAEKSNILLIEEPENHLTYSKLNKLINNIYECSQDKQIFICTHSSFVANKLGLANLILLNKGKTLKFKELDNLTNNDDTKSFFMKKPGYDTLRFLLCKKAILVEGDADELIIQRAYKDINNKLPIEDEIEIISVGTTFLRFLKLATILEKHTVVVTDNDGDIDALNEKYKEYLNENNKDFIEICFDKQVHTNQGNMKKKNGNNYNYDTLEPCLLRENSREDFNIIFGKKYANDDDLILYMVGNKTECALKIFECERKIKYPKYINEAIGNKNE